MQAKQELERMMQMKDRQSRLKFDQKILQELKPILLQATRGKCVYCETSLTGYSSVENFRPRSGAKGLGRDYAPEHYWWLAYEWTNLVISCEICAKHKRDFFPLENERMRCRIGTTGKQLEAEKALLIDPFSEDPKEHLDFMDSGSVKPLSVKGKTTIELLGLNRVPLVKARARAAKALLDDLRILKKQSTTSRTFENVQTRVKALQANLLQHEYAAVLHPILKRWNAQSSIEISTEHISPVSLPKSFATKITKSQEQKVTRKVSELRRFSIKTIEIQNFRSIDHLTLNVLPADKEGGREPWLLMLGDNGIGKSSILQAIALALAGSKEIKRQRLSPKEFLRREAKSGFVKIHSYESDTPIELTFNATKFTSSIETSPTYVMAYGSTRLLPKGKLKPDAHRIYTNIRNLFDYSISLKDPNKWFKSLSAKEFDSRVASAFFDLLALRKKDRVLIKKGQLVIQQFDEEIPLEKNSDGFKSVIAIAADIMQTLARDSVNYHSSNGIVLVDELGNHLHPRWRMKIVDALRETFPNLQFIVTTHEPLCLRGCRHGEVGVLVRDQNFSIKVLEKDLLPDHTLMRVDQLLTSDLFGLINILDTESEKTYEEYYHLLNKPETERTSSENARIDQLGASLSAKELQGSTPQLQALYKVVNEQYVKNMREHGFKPKEQLKEETVTEVKKIISAKKIDWL
jgi:uncharacterized protein (TIGR02646 family)